VLQSGGAQTVSSLMFAVPVLLGAFSGAPLLSRELESGTFRFAWTQGAGRTRWPSAGVGKTGASNSSGWVISDLEKAPNGQELSRDDLYHYFQQLPSSAQNSANSYAFTTWLTKHGYTSWTSLQPNSRFWEFQLIEGGWLLALSAALIGGTVWLVRRRGA
jgi:hypothetical protein